MPQLHNVTYFSSGLGMFVRVGRKPNPCCAVRRPGANNGAVPSLTELLRLHTQTAASLRYVRRGRCIRLDERRPCKLGQSYPYTFQLSIQYDIVS